MKTAEVENISFKRVKHMKKLFFFSLLAQIYKKHFFKKRKSLKKTGLEKPRITFRKLLYKVNKTKQDVAELNF